jgi:hypothetical protein
MTKELGISLCGLHIIVHDHLDYRKLHAGIQRSSHTITKLIIQYCVLTIWHVMLIKEISFCSAVVTRVKHELFMLHPKPKDMLMGRHPLFHPVQEFKVKALVWTIFWGHKGVLLVHVLDFGDTVTAEHYCGTLEVLWQAVCYKKPGCHASCMIMPYLLLLSGLVIMLWCYAWEVMDHACHSPVHILSGFHLCGHCKKHAPVKRFATNAKVRQTVTSLTLIFIILGYQPLFHCGANV